MNALADGNFAYLLDLWYPFKGNLKILNMKQTRKSYHYGVIVTKQTIDFETYLDDQGVVDFTRFDQKYQHSLGKLKVSNITHLKH